MLSRQPVDLEHKVAIVTGGGTGIGRAVTLDLAHFGARVVVCGRRKNRLEDVVSAVRTGGGEGLAVQADVSSETDVDNVVKTAMKAYGQIDVLVNNAGVSESGLIHEITPDTWERMMATNLRGPFLMTRAVLPSVREQRSGHVINISSESGIEHYHGDASYGTSKHALNTLSEYTQRENQDRNIRVNTICPGMVVTEMTENEPGLVYERCLYPEDISDLVVFLLTRRANIKIGTPVLIQTMLDPWKKE